MRLVVMSGGIQLPPRFDLLGPLGRGGMGVVYEVLDRERGRRMALKCVRELHPRALRRFKDEFRAARDVEHPNLVRLGELIEDAGTWYFTMELVTGEDFMRYVRADRALPDAGAGATRSSPCGQTAPTRPIGLHAASANGGDSRSDDRLPAPPVDLSRLRDAFGQLATGIAALHRAGKLHRDIKPSNVLVDEGGRVVILDFGLVVGAGDKYGPGGTVSYMAPEQSGQTALGPETDWYAVGVMLFEALTGRLPFRDDDDNQLLARKRTFDAPGVDDLVADAPADLVELTARLLQRAPGARPSEREVLAALRGDDPDLWAADAPAAAATPSPFIGREAELAALLRAYDDAATGRCVAVFLEGESGVGKTATMRELLGRLKAREPTIAVLQGRCHEKEAVPYNAFDGVIDRLAAILAREGREPGPGLTLLARLFPSLPAGADSGDSEPMPAPELRHRAFEALRELLCDFADHRPLVIAIDDIQWADVESIALLAELCRPPAAVPMLLVATARQPPDGEPAAAARVAGDDVRRLPLHGLSDRDARALVTALAGDLLDVNNIVVDTAGHPMFIEELVRHSRTTGAGQSLDEAVRARARRLPDGCRRLLEAVAVAGAPLPQAVTAAAAGLDGNALADAVATLRAARLVRIRGAGPRDPIEPFHARVREAIYSGLDDDRRRVLHLALARALPPTSRAELVAHHLALGGDTAGSADRYEAAARDALTALAFERAAALFEAALANGDHRPDSRRRLLPLLGDALALAGRPGDAGRAYREGEILADSDDRLELLRRAAESYLTGGYLKEGLDTTRRLLRAFGLSLPRTRPGAVAALLYHQTRLDHHRLEWRSTTASGDGDRALMDVYWSVGAGLGMVDTVRGALFLTRGARVCLAAGDEPRIARALMAVAFAHAGLGRLRQVDRLIEACKRAAEADGSALAAFYHRMALATSTFIAANDWSTSLQECGNARALWSQAGRRGGYEADVVDQIEYWSLGNLGRLRELCDRVPARIRAAQRAGDRFLEVNFRTFFTDIHLAGDDPDSARRDVTDAIDSWLPGHDQFGNQDYLALRSLTHIALYAGEVDRDAGQLEHQWQRFFRSLMSRVLLLRADGLGRSGAFALARAIGARRRGQHSAARALANRSRRARRKLAGIPIPWAGDDELHLAAALAGFDGDTDGQVHSLRAALGRANDRAMALNAACIRWRLADVVGGSEADELRAAAGAWARCEGVTNLARYAQALLPAAEDG